MATDLSCRRWDSRLGVRRDQKPGLGAAALSLAALQRALPCPRALTHGVGIDHVAQHHHAALPVGVQLLEGFCTALDVQGLLPEDMQHRELSAGAEAGRAIVQHSLRTHVLGGHFVHAAAARGRTRCQTSRSPLLAPQCPARAALALSPTRQRSSSAGAAR